MNFYNEIDPAAAAWLRGLIASGEIPPGVVDERSITDINPDELLAYTQCHFFAGIGGWSLAFQLARWDPARPVWSGSCPCPPFSSAGKKKACPVCEGKPLPHPRKNGVFACIPCGHEWYADERHLWPAFFRHIAHCQPPVVFGEQVAGADGLLWLAGVRATMEGIAYGFGAADLCAAGVKSPMLRQRLFWVGERVADTEDANRRSQQQSGSERGGRGGSAGSGEARGLAHTSGERLGGIDQPDGQADQGRPADDVRCAVGRLADRLGAGLQGHAGDGDRGSEPGRLDADAAGSTAAGGATGRVANTSSSAGPEHEREPRDGSRGQAGTHDGPECRGDHGGLAYTNGVDGDRGRPCASDDCGQRGTSELLGVEAGSGLGDSHDSRRGERGERDCEPEQPGLEAPCGTDPDRPNPWSDAYWLECRDGKYRRVPTQPALFPLADGFPYKLARRGSIRPALLKGAGNAIVPQVAAEFIAAFLSIEGNET